MTDNPYAAPTASVEPPIVPRPFELHEPRSLGIGRGVGWIAEGFEHFKKDPGQWIVICIVGFGIMMALSLVPLLNMLSSLLAYVWLGGLMLGCKAQDDGGSISISHLFAGFQNKVGPLILLGLLFSLATILIMLVAMGPLYMQLITAGMSGDPAAIEGLFEGMTVTSVLLPILLGTLFIIPLTMFVWFAPMLIVLNDVPLFKAMGMSFKGCIKNILPFFVYGLVVSLLFIPAVIPLFLGLLVLGPSVFGSMYRAYKDIYIS